ncbi:MAG TPA: sulfite exporter TauE/SafE family protein [Desulfuromonadales bacterium]|nr:sulfite exporter TauE/SafE family protein [Desulfuromonadales bacterium]
MELDSLFWVAFQSSIILGLVHGVNPCGHSWLVLAPFVVGEKRGRKVAFLTFAFLAGTTLACLVLGVTLGAVSAVIPEAMEHWVEVGTSVLLIILGAVLIIKPDLIHHHHDEEHGHDHSHDIEQIHEHEAHQEHAHSPLPLHAQTPGKKRKLTGLALFGIGFVNMIIPCPTVAIMYGYALDSGSALKATFVFGVYAVATSIAVGGVIYAIFHVARLLERLSQDWVENALMRGAGVVTIIFAVYSLLTH